MENQSTSQKEKNILLPASILVAALLISGAVIYGTGSKSLEKTSPRPATQQAQVAGQVGGSVVYADDDAFLGKKDAPVTIVEFSDFQCPFCRKFWRETLPKIKQDYIDTGKAKFVYRDFPLSFHPGAQPAAEGAECAGDQGKFWEMHDAIFAEQEKQGSGTIQFFAEDVKARATKLGLNMTQFNNCLDSGKYRSETERDYQDGIAAGVQGTPGTFINGQLVSGAQPFSVFKAVIDNELKKLGK